MLDKFLRDLNATLAENFGDQFEIKQTSPATVQKDDPKELGDSDVHPNVHCDM